MHSCELGAPLAVNGEPVESAPEPESRVLVLCLGNDFRADDGVGWAVADELERRDLPAGVQLLKSAAAGLYLLDDLQGFERVIVVDAIATGRRPPGTVLSFPFHQLADERGPSPHSSGLATVIDGAARWGVELPRELQVVAVETLDMQTIGAQLTPKVSGAVAPTADMVLELLTTMLEVRP